MCPVGVDVAILALVWAGWCSGACSVGVVVSLIGFVPILRDGGDDDGCSCCADGVSGSWGSDCESVVCQVDCIVAACRAHLLLINYGATTVTTAIILTTGLLLLLLLLLLLFLNVTIYFF